MSLKKCSKCGVEKIHDHYWYVKNTVCKKCYHKNYNDNFYKKIKKSKIDAGVYNCKCENCHNPFISNKIGVRFCSIKCNNDNWYLKEREKVNLNKKCLKCGLPFIAKSVRAVYCSSKCSSSHYKMRFPHLHATRQAIRRANKLQATPKWLTKEDLKKIEAYYRLAKFLTYKTKKAYEVDHLIPLNGKNVSGLHVPWNLQVITAEENRIKNNKIIMEFV